MPASPERGSNTGAAAEQAEKAAQEKQKKENQDRMRGLLFSTFTPEERTKNNIDESRVVKPETLTDAQATEMLTHMHNEQLKAERAYHELAQHSGKPENADMREKNNERQRRLLDLARRIETLREQINNRKKPDVKKPVVDAIWDEETPPTPPKKPSRTRALRPGDKPNPKGVDAFWDDELPPVVPPVKPEVPPRPEVPPAPPRPETPKTPEVPKTPEDESPSFEELKAIAAEKRNEFVIWSNKIRKYQGFGAVNRFTTNGKTEYWVMKEEYDNAEKEYREAEAEMIGASQMLMVEERMQLAAEMETEKAKVMPWYKKAIDSYKKLSLTKRVLIGGALVGGGFAVGSVGGALGVAGAVAFATAKTAFSGFGTGLGVYGGAERLFISQTSEKLNAKEVSEMTTEQIDKLMQNVETSATHGSKSVKGHEGYKVLYAERMKRAEAVDMETQEALETMPEKARETMHAAELKVREMHGASSALWAEQVKVKRWKDTAAKAIGAIAALASVGIMEGWFEKAPVAPPVPTGLPVYESVKPGSGIVDTVEAIVKKNPAQYGVKNTANDIHKFAVDAYYKLQDADPRFSTSNMVEEIRLKVGDKVGLTKAGDILLDQAKDYFSKRTMPWTK
ncbi:MAG: hypothetical protein WCJ29_01660 [bacterium]